MIDKNLIGLELPEVRWAVEHGRLLAFARAIGETRPEYVDDAAARAAGHRGLLAPPTFWFSGGLDAGSFDTLLARLQVPIARVLHGGQSFSYHRDVCAGDVLRFCTKVTDITDKKGGKMEFITQHTRVFNQDNECVGESQSTIVVRN